MAFDTDTVDDMDSAVAAIGELNLGGDDDLRRVEGDQDADDSDDDADEDQDQSEGDLELEDDEDGDSDEPDSPAIDAPASLTAEEKAAFADLDPKSQRYVANLEARRADQVQTATTKASEAQRAAEAAAARADATAQAKYAQQLKAFGDNLAPQAPDPQLAYVDPQAFIAQQAQYQAAKAQHDEFMQQVQSLGSDAENAVSETEIAQRDRELMTIPEVQNEATRNTFFEKAFEAGKTLGLDTNQMQHATAAELKALRQVSDWQDKAKKYDAALAKNMQRVREGKKARTAKPNAAQPSSGHRQGYGEARQRLSQSGDVKDAAAALARL